MKKKIIKENKNEYTQENIKKKRSFPVKNTIILIICILAQIACVFLIVQIDIKPKDIIREYDVTVEPLDDGTLDIEYRLVWTAMDKKEALTWVEIGLATPNFHVYEETLSETIESCGIVDEDYFCGVTLDLDRPYVGGETVEFSFKINQDDMLLYDENGYFYEFIPGWFNSIPVEEYTFKWKDNGQIKSAEGGELKDGYYTWQGSFDCGEYEKMRVKYTEEAFRGKETTAYEPFDDSEAYNTLESDANLKNGIFIIAIFVIFLKEISIFDCYISYHRGRGFLTSCGYHIHTYGSQNPKYVRAYNRKYGSSGHYGRGYGRGGGGGCACACACACAGGGRAGCSQKDTYENKKISG